MPRDERWFPDLTGKATPEVVLAFRYLFQQLYAIKPPTPPSPPPIPIDTIRKELQADGHYPILVTGLSGLLSEPQKARAYVVTALPALNDPLSQPGTLIIYNSLLYFFDSSTNPGSWIAVKTLGYIFADTHANRLANYPASKYEGVGFFETDRGALYRSNGTNWIWMAGVMRDTAANRPADLGTSDKNFTYFATDTKVNSYWTGSAWTDLPSGTVTSVAMTVPSIMSVAGSPITSSGSLDVTLTTEAANLVFAGPASGAAAVPTFRALVAADIPAGGTPPAWDSYTPTVASASGVVTTTTLEAAKYVTGKLTYFRIYWKGQVSLASAWISFTTPVTGAGTTAQGCSCGYFNAALTYLAGPSSGFISDSTNVVYAASTTDFPATTDFVLIIEGVYEGA